MPTLRNPAENRLFCHRLQRILEPDEEVEISDEEADDLAGGAIFVVEREASSKPVRETAKRGSKRAEVASSPEVEKRG